MERRLAFLLLVLVGSFGCAIIRTSDRTFLSNATAAYTWQEARYEARCVEVKGPSDCLAFQADLREAKKQLATADRVIRVGSIPSDERAVIQKAMKRAKAHQ